MKSNKLLKREIVSIFAVLILLSGFFTGCPGTTGSTADDPVTVESIFVKPPNQTACFLEDDEEAEINLKGMVVSVNYSNGATEKVSVDNDTAIIKIGKTGETSTVSFNGITATFTVTSDGFTIAYAGIVFTVSGFDLEPGEKTITVSYDTFSVDFSFTIIEDDGKPAADIGYQKAPVFAGENAVVRYPVKIRRQANENLLLKWFDEDENELTGSAPVGEMSPDASGDDEMAITLNPGTKAGKYFFELGFISRIPPWTAVSRKAELIVSKLPDMGVITSSKLSAKWYETQAAADAAGGNYLIELTGGGEVKTPALGNPDLPVGTWVVDIPGKCITITAIGSYALFGSADITYEFEGTTKIHVQSSSPITALIGLSEKDLFKKAQ